MLYRLSPEDKKIPKNLDGKYPIPTFAVLNGLPDSIMAVQLILVQFVLVRIQVGQQVTLSKAEGFFCMVAKRTCSL